MIRGARDRSVLLLRMIATTDPFLIDDIQREMDIVALSITQAAQQISQRVTDQDHQAWLKQLFRITTQNRDNQSHVYNLMTQENADNARQFLVDVTLPVQEQALEILTLFQEELNTKANLAEQKMHGYLSSNKVLWISLSLVFGISLLIISLFTLKRLRQLGQAQTLFQQTLETQVKKRTLELHLDSSVLHNIHEAVAVASCTGDMVKTNQKFNQLLSSANLTCDNLWQVIQTLLPALSIESIKKSLGEYGYTRHECELVIDTRACHYFIDIYCVNDEQLDQRYISLLLTDVSELKTTQQHLEHLANFDPVTQLPNRHYFQTYLSRALSNEKIEQFSLFYIDLDNFKWINDTLGHGSGDQFLLQIATQLANTFETNRQVLVCRLGGDEFAVLVENCDDNCHVMMADQILNCCAQVNQINQYSKSIGCSIGVASYPKDGTTQAALMRHADFAMYKAKEQGKNQYCFFSEAMNERIHYLYDMEHNLQTALTNHELNIHFQPQYNLQNGQLTGAEALVRWQHLGKAVSPAEFIPLAEKFGLIHAIGEFVMRTSIQQLAHWQQQGLLLPKMAINVSSAQISLHSFVADVEHALKNSDIHAHQIDLEITETVLMENLKQHKTALEVLQNQGIEISIDDFGTGYSSLAYIKHLSVDRIKIDRSFINDLGQNEESDSIVSAIITMGHSLGLKVLAEGIETAQQLTLLRKMGCDEGQGYYLGYPTTPKEFSFIPLSIQQLADRVTLQ
ncbi:EAL domain-containing protein [Thiomicrorhabdus aquaedulcis]|uniref:EAL domain-containing protein n=1 Tax=Thiomicrorhabdus aquaedulcis TaxID=2211106 RepID=UPI000FD9EAF3|nr:EAL domain-containing protein [Thiomicrorhabdus aquaedulcis]